MYFFVFSESVHKTMAFLSLVAHELGAHNIDLIGMINAIRLTANVNQMSCQQFHAHNGERCKRKKLNSI